MLRGLLSMFLVGRLFRMISGRGGRHSHAQSMYHRGHSYGWGHRGGHHFPDIGTLFGLGRRRRSFI